MKDLLAHLVVEGLPVSQKNSKRIARTSVGRRFVISEPRVRRWKLEAVSQLAAQWRRPPLLMPINVSLICYLHPRQRIDCDNLAAGPLDALQAARVIGNDSQVERLTVVRLRDRDRPRIGILITMHQERRDDDPTN